MGVFVGGKTKLTYEDYALLPDDGMIHEIIDGDHYMTPAPSTYHQTVSRRIQFQLYEQIEEQDKGQVFNAPTDVQFSNFDIVQPDVFVILKARVRMISPSRVLGNPDLVIEILSESTQKKDQKLKLDLYQKGGVPEYWIVDPEKHTVMKFLLKDGVLQSVGTFTDEISYEGIPGVKVDLHRVW